ncbi:hypothetical protein SAMN00777080_0756 [Aquiflexum balticum DSM 16537]|uniref:Uncharacterized protein n=1 Tax=Aquiflexum balticum DSM 16537 TaxID=758820 RepID=A0A1W2H147_9BACT|nr:hypothetical protein [Aquiflexum balticum]SMD42216.1 hypothetical protein SAMN00777080_0756 [Aquiflexum balticum DSM 16537]
MKSNISNIRKVGFGIFMLIYFLSLFNNILFVHSHWYEGNLVALHAHPYSLDFDIEGNKKKDSHSKKEYELYDLIYNAPILGLEFFDFEIRPFTNELNTTFSIVLTSYESKNKPFHDVRGPPVLV